MNKRTPTCSLTRPGASRQIRLTKASSHQLWLTWGGPVMLQSSPCILDYTEGLGKKNKIYAKSACQSLQRWLTLLWRLCSWCTDTLKQGTEYCPQDGEWPAWLLYGYELHTAVILSPTGNHWTLQTVSLRDVETKSGIIYFVKTSY